MSLLGSFALLYLLTLTWRATDVLKQSSRVNSKTSKGHLSVSKRVGKRGSCELENVCRQGVSSLSHCLPFFLPLSLSFSSLLRAVPVMDLHCQVMVAIKDTLLFSHSVMPDSLRPYGLQHARPLCSSPSPEVCPSSCPLPWWCHPVISSSDAFSFFPQSFPASGTKRHLLYLKEYGSLWSEWGWGGSCSLKNIGLSHLGYLCLSFISLLST